MLPASLMALQPSLAAMAADGTLAGS